jgi:hypothetical protein
LSTYLSFDRLQQALRGPRDRVVLVELAEAWPSIRSWWATPVENVAPGEDALGFEASATNDRTFELVMFRLVGTPPRTTEHGVEFAYSLDDDWLAALRGWPAWDWEHSIGFHDWGPGEAGVRHFADSIERLAIFQLALHKPCVRLRLFSPVGDDYIAPPHSV